MRTDWAVGGPIGVPLVSKGHADQRLKRGESNVEVVDCGYLIPFSLRQVRLRVDDLDG